MRYWLLFLVLGVQSAWGELTVEVQGGVGNQVPIAIVPFDSSSTERGLAKKIQNTIAYNLHRSGFYRDVVKSLAEPLQAGKVINSTFFRLLGAEFVISGTLVRQSATDYVVDVTILDVLRKQPLKQKRWAIAAGQDRQVAHLISDDIFEAILGVKGIFSHRISYVLSQRIKDSLKKRYLLQVADSDGQNAQTVLESSEPILSPSWSPDGRQLVYTSFENGRPEIFVHSLGTAVRVKMVAFKGINFAPSWSPDGKKIVFSSSRLGQPDLYIMDVKTRSLRRLTEHEAIDAEPVFSADGRSVYFTSDRSGSPQIYVYNLTNGTIKRVTQEGSNTKASPNPQGDSLAMISKIDGVWALSLFSLKNKERTTIAHTFLDESPAFAPNGLMIMYAATNRKSGIGQLVVVSLNGGAHHVLKSAGGDVRDPAWSPRPVDF